MKTLMEALNPESLIAPTEIEGVPFSLGWHQPQMYFCHKVPPLGYKKVEKLYWQNDVDGVNRLIEEHVNASDIRHLWIHFCKNSGSLREIGIHIPYAEPEVVDVTTVAEGSVFFGLDDEGDLVRAELA